MSDIAITGTGVISAAGRGIDRALGAMAGGEACFGPPGHLPWPVATVQPGDIPWPEGGSWPDNRKYANVAAHAAVAVSGQALDRAGTAAGDESVRCGTIMAVGTSGADELGDVIPRLAAMAETDPRPLAKLLYDEVPDYSYIRGIPSQIGQFVSMAAGFSGSNVAVYGEPAAGGLGALALAARLLRSGELDRVLVIGVAPPLSAVALLAFDRIEPLGTEAVPGRGPFDVGRAGTLPGQGAVAVLVERAGTAAARGVRPLAGLRECETVCAGSAPAALDAAVGMVLGPAEWRPDLWWAHGAGSVASDYDECQVVGGHLPGVPATSSKGTLGNAFECAGLIDVALAVAALDLELAPPVGLLRKPDPLLDGVEVVADRARPLPGARSALVTSLGHGGSPSAGAALIEKGGDR